MNILIFTYRRRIYNRFRRYKNIYPKPTNQISSINQAQQIVKYARDSQATNKIDVE